MCLCSHYLARSAAVRGWSNIFGLRLAAETNLSSLWLSSTAFASTASRSERVALKFLLTKRIGAYRGWIVAGRMDVAVVPSSWTMSIVAANSME